MTTDTLPPALIRALALSCHALAAQAVRAHEAAQPGAAEALAGRLHAGAAFRLTVDFSPQSALFEAALHLVAVDGVHPLGEIAFDVPEVN